MTRDDPSTEPVRNDIMENNYTKVKLLHKYV